MKPVNLQTLILPLIGWVYDFQKDNKRLPDSLEDLIANRSPSRDYNPERSIVRNQNEGFSFAYTAKTGGGFEVKVSKDNEAVVYDNATDTLSFYRADELQHRMELN